MRADLLALTPESLALFSNVGLVKRAQKEVDSGAGPTLDEDASGTVVATSKDGATTRLLPATPLRATSCSCGAAGACRHRIAAVLAYQRLHGVAPSAGAGAAASASGAAQSGAAHVSAPWDPGAIDDAALRAACGDLAFGRAEAALSASLLVELAPGAIPVARLPIATVQFPVPNDLAHARCDCALGHGCEHVALAVWAFRKAAGGTSVELGAAPAPVDAGCLGAVLAELEGVLASGLAEHGSGEALARARVTADRAGFVWLVDAIEDLERQRDAWERRSARFSGRVAARLAAEIGARARAASAPAEARPRLPARFVLGADEPRQTLTAELRLTPLGVRLDSDGDRRFATVVFADRDNKHALVLKKEWPAPPSGKPKDGFDLGELYASSRLTLAALTRADLVARGALRRANGEIDLGSARGLKSSALPGEVAWADLPAPLQIRDLRAFEDALRAAPPAFLAPRRAGADVHVIGVSAVRGVVYRRGEQTLSAELVDPSGGSFLLRVQHRSVSPGAIDATAAALARGPRFVAGELTLGRSGFVLSPLAILGERLVVPDLEKPRAIELPPADPSALTEADDPLDAPLSALDALVERAAQKGVLAIAEREREQAARGLDEVGLARVAAAVRRATTPRAVLDLAIVCACFERAR